MVSDSNPYCADANYMLAGVSWDESKEVVDALLKAGAKVNLKSENEKNGGQTPLHYAVLFCNAGNEEVVQLLLDAGADPTLTNDDGHTPEQTMKIHTHQQIIENYRKYAATLKAISNIVKMLKPYYGNTETAAFDSPQRVSHSYSAPSACRAHYAYLTCQTLKPQMCDYN